MKALRFLRALPLAFMLLAPPAMAAQSTIVGPTVGPKTMTEVMTTLNAALLAIQSCNSGTGAPANGVGGLSTPYQCWADTSGAPTILYKTYDGTSWVTFGSLNTSTHVWTPYRNGAAIVAVATSGSASDLTAGTLPAARLPNPSASTLGGVQSLTCSASQWLNLISTSGVPACAQPNFTDVAGTLALAQLPAFSGMSAAAAAADTDTVPTNQGAGNLKQTLAAIKTWVKAWIAKADVGLGNVDNTSDATKWAATKTLTNTTYSCSGTGNVCTVRIGSDVTGLGTGIAAALAINTGFAGAPVLYNGALGTPSSGVATNLTGTAASLTAGNVTTNANLTGEVTSVGNATTVTNASVIGKLLTAFSAGAGTVSSSDSILTALQKIVGNIALKADIASPNFSGTPAAPSAAADTNTTQLATTAFVVGQKGTANPLVNGTVAPGTSLRYAAQDHVHPTDTSRAAAANSALTGTTDSQGTLKLSGFVTSTQLTANANDYTGTDGSNTCSTKAALRVSTNASRNISGLSCGQAEGDLRVIHNVGAFPAVLTNQDTGSTAANRFLFGGDLTLAADASITVRYDGVASRWRAIVLPGAGGGGGGGVTSVAVAAGQGIGVSGTCTITTSGTCTASLTDQYRMNLALDRIYQSKLFGYSRRVANAWATGFKASTDTLRGINAGGSTNYDVTNASASGYIAPTASGTSVTIDAPSTASALGGLTYISRLTALINGQSVYSIGYYSTTAVSVSLKIVKRNSVGNYDVVWSQAYAHTGSGWEDMVLTSPYAVAASGTFYVAGYNGAGGSFAISGPSVRAYASGDVIGTGQAFTEDSSNHLALRYTYAYSPNNMTILTSTQIADPGPTTKAEVSVEYDNTASLTAGTDFTLEATCDGSNYVAASTYYVATGQDGRKAAKTNEMSCTSGSSFLARFKTLTNKNMPTYGLGITVN